MFIPTKKKGPRANVPQYTGKLRLRVGDLVRVLTGKDRGKEGKVTRVLPGQGKVVVEGLNIVIKHQKSNPRGQSTASVQAPQGGRIEQAAPLQASKLQLVDPGNSDRTTRIGIRLDENGNRTRYARKSGSVLDNG